MDYFLLIPIQEHLGVLDCFRKEVLTCACVF